MSAPAAPASADVLARLAAVIVARRGADPSTSYVARLLAKGEDAVLKKIGEEAIEVVMACKDGQPERIVAEVADLWFHSMLALARHGLTPADVLAELERREGLSGLEEFALRKAQSREQRSRSSFEGSSRGATTATGTPAPWPRILAPIGTQGTPAAMRATRVAPASIRSSFSRPMVFLSPAPTLEVGHFPWRSSGWRSRIYSYLSLTWPVRSSKSGVPPAYIVSGGSP